jgi:hypothetical protein
MARLRRALPWGLVLGASLLLAGCFTDPDIGEVVDAIAWEIEPAHLNPDVELRLGSGSLSLARGICGFVDDCEEYASLLEGVRMVHLGVYQIEGPHRGQSLDFDEDLRRDLEAEGWHPVVHVRDRGGETALALTRMDERGDLSGMYVVSVDRDEVVVVKLEGDLSKPLDCVLRRDEGFLAALGNSR